MSVYYSTTSDHVMRSHLVANSQRNDRVTIHISDARLKPWQPALTCTAWNEIEILDVWMPPLGKERQWVYYVTMMDLLQWLNSELEMHNYELLWNVCTHENVIRINFRSYSSVQYGTWLIFMSEVLRPCKQRLTWCWSNWISWCQWAPTWQIFTTDVVRCWMMQKA